MDGLIDFLIFVGFIGFCIFFDKLNNEENSETIEPKARSGSYSATTEALSTTTPKELCQKGKESKRQD